MVETHGHLPERYILGKKSETEGVRDILFLAGFSIITIH